MNAVELAKIAHKQSIDKKNHSDVCIYNKSNENLDELFKHFDFTNKDVLSVLASSDQLFTCYTKNAKSVDTFDYVYPTLYYYYLRKWLILYKDLLYIPNDFFENPDYSMYNFISSIKTNDKKEEEAKTYWKKILQLNNYQLDEYLFYFTKNKYACPFSDNISCLKSKLRKNINFYHLDISAKEISLNKKYDVIILSNIMEFQNNDFKLIRVRNNIENLLKDDGIAICSCLLDRINSDYHRNQIKYMTSNKLIVDSETNYYDRTSKKQKDLYYTYRKCR